MKEAKFCPNCGAPIISETSPQAPQQQARGSRQPARPIGVGILAVLEGIVSLFAFIGGIALIGLAAFLGAGGWGVIPEQELERAFREMPWARGFAGVRVIALTTAILTVIGIIVLLLGIIGLAMAWGLWAGKSWARTITIVLAVIGILSSIFSLPGGILSILINVAIIYYLTRPHVKAYYYR